MITINNYNKKILHIIIGLNKGGAETVLYDLLKNDINTSQKLNKHIVISLTNKGHFGKYLLECGVVLHCLNINKNIFNLFRLPSLIKKYNPDFIQTWMHHSNLIGSLFNFFNRNIKLIWTIHSLDLNKNFNKKSTLFIAKICSILSYVSPYKIIFVSEMSKSNHLNYGFNKKISMVIHNGVDIFKYKKNVNVRSTFRSLYNIDSNVFLIGKVARWDKYKDHENLFKALYLLKTKVINFKCILVGNGLDSNNIELNELIQKYSLTDFLILAGQQDDIPMIMNALDVHVLSSVGESMPISLLEAMSCGTICIATDVGSCREIISNFGILVTPQDPSSLFDSLIYIYNLNKNQLNQLSVDGIKHIEENFSIKLMSNQYNNIWSF